MARPLWELCWLLNCSNNAALASTEPSVARRGPGASWLAVHHSSVLQGVPSSEAELCWNGSAAAGAVAVWDVLRLSLAAARASSACERTS